MKTHPTAACVLILRKGSVLGVSRKENLMDFGLPGGKIEKDEDPKFAAVRELLEETGLKVDPKDLVLLWKREEPETGNTVVTFWAPDPGGDICPEEGEALCLWVGWPTILSEKCTFGKYNQKVFEAFHEKIPEAWIQKNGSGTLLRSLSEGMRWKDLYLCERVAFEFGYGFEPVLLSRLTVGEALAEGDCPGTTETLWWVRVLRERARLMNFSHEYKVCHATVSIDGETREGISIQCIPEPRPFWLPESYTLIAFTTKKNGETENPC